MLSGRRKDYPITLYDGANKKEIPIKDSDELITFLDEPFNKSKDLKDILFIYGLDDNSIQIADFRTMDIIKNYEFYKFNPSQAFDNDVWFESVYILNLIQPRLF